MGYVERIQITLNYIEERLDQPITLSELASLACFSDFHYHRVFQTMTGDSVMEYVRKRRLSRAAEALLRTDRRVLDIALDCGFQSHETFARAFKRHFQVTPHGHRRARLSLALQPKIVLSHYAVNSRGGTMMQPKLATKPAFHVIGYGLETVIHEGQNHKDIPAFWQRYIRENLGQNIPNKLRPDVEMGICTSFDPETGTFTYLIGCEVSSLEHVPEGMIGHTVPEATYAVFTTPAADDANFSNTIQQTWVSIFQDWFPTSGYEHAGGQEIEWYDNRSADPSAKQMDILIPIRKQEQPTPSV